MIILPDTNLCIGCLVKAAVTSISDASLTEFAGPEKIRVNDNDIYKPDRF